jgi:hypothetical protein
VWNLSFLDALFFWPANGHGGCTLRDILVAIMVVTTIIAAAAGFFALLLL